MRVASCLANPNAPEASLQVTSVGLVEHYLARLGRDDIVLAAAHVEEHKATYSADTRFYPGQRLHHAVSGEGEVAAVEGNASDPVIDVRFDQAGRRRLIARRAPIQLLEGSQSAILS